MNKGVKFLLVLLGIVLIVAATFFLTTYIYNIEFFANKQLQLYGSLSGAVIGLMLSFIAVLKSDKQKHQLVESKDNNVEKAMISEPVVDTQKDKELEAIEYPETTETIPLVEESQEELEKTQVHQILTDGYVEKIIDPEQIVDQPKDANWPSVDDTTMIINTAEINDLQDSGEVLQAEANKSTLILTSPLGPKGESEQTTNETQEEVVDSESSSHEWLTAPINEDELSKTQQSYIEQSTSSYIDEAGQPQFRITQEMPKMQVPEEEFTDDFIGYDKRVESRDRLSGFLNSIMTIVFIALALAIIYIAYAKFFG